MSKIIKTTQLHLFKRDITLTLGQRLKEMARSIQVVIGPRQVGKTTAIKQLLREYEAPYHYAAADLPAPPEPAWITEEWNRARALIEKKAHAILVID